MKKKKGKKEREKKRACRFRTAFTLEKGIMKKWDGKKKERQRRSLNRKNDIQGLQGGHRTFHSL